MAHALETHKTITGEDVSAIVDRKVGPFLDGRGYYTPDAIRALEDYHEAVLELRRTGGMTLPRLPKIAGITGRLVEAVAVPVGAGAAAGSESSSPTAKTTSRPTPSARRLGLSTGPFPRGGWRQQGDVLR